MPTRIVPMPSVARRGPFQQSRRRAGFSLIEILIAIGVIVVLAGIGVYGYQSLQESTAKKQAYTVLASGDALLKELASTGSATRIEGPDTQSPAPVFPVTASGGPPTFASPGDINVGKSGRNTIINGKLKEYMAVLQSVPANKKAIQSLPREAVVPPPEGTSTPYNPPMIADPWQNPILLIPSGGLTGVTTQGGSNLTIVSPSKRPFWASAGPDGDFTKGDDNLYSFDK